jgi:diacylglycerol kinase (ATP)
MDAVAIVNPRSGGKRTAKRWPTVEARLREVVPQLEVRRTDGPHVATRLTRDALREGAGLVVAVGGDGTVNEVVNGFFDEQGEPLGVQAELGILMMGTGGDFRRSFGIEDGWEACVARLAEGNTRTIDLGRIELTGDDGATVVRMFDNIASFGVSGSIVRSVNEARWSKLLGGRFAFRWCTLLGLLRYRPTKVRLRVDDHFDQIVDLTMCAVANGQFFGGGMHVAPQAKLDDGQLDVVITEGMGALDFVRNSAKLSSGEHLGMPGVRFVRGRRIVAEAVDEDQVVLIDADGEGPGRLPATFEILPAALRVRA